MIFRKLFKKKKNKSICLDCEIGLETLLIEPYQTLCPYAHSCDGANCKFYKKMKN